MNRKVIYGENTYFCDDRSEPEAIARLVSCGVQASDNGIIYLDENERCVYANRHAFAMFHVPDRLDSLKDIFYNWMDSIGIEHTAANWCRVYISHGYDRLYKVRYRRLMDEDNHFLGHMYSISNISDMVANNTGEHYRLTHDELTHLYNREGFTQAVKELMQITTEKYILLYSNIKDFKLINQLFGLEKGNEILINISEMLAQNVKDDDVYGRVTGDHFALCMPKARFDEKEFKKIVREVTGRISSKTYAIHVQIGVYEIIDPRMDVTLMCDRAFMACKSIKRDNTVEIAWYSDEMLVNALLEKEILSSFDFAIINRQFGIYLQPQVAPDGTLFGCEALARWLHPENGVIEPGIFINVLEKADLIYKLDRYIWELAAEQLAKWKGTEREGISISVNVSPKDLYYLDIKKEFTELVNKYDINPGLLNIEITETAVTSDVNKCAKLILDLQSNGFVVEIDDFGSGYSSLNLLKDINADILKIDMGFIRKTENYKRAQVILSYTIDMAHELGMNVVTEGVETRDQLDFLTGMGCEMFQGFYFDRPMPVEDFEKKYSKGVKR